MAKTADRHPEHRRPAEAGAAAESAGSFAARRAKSGSPRSRSPYSSRSSTRPASASASWRRRSASRRLRSRITSTGSSATGSSAAPRARPIAAVSVWRSRTRASACFAACGPAAPRGSRPGCAASRPRSSMPSRRRSSRSGISCTRTSAREADVLEPPIPELPALLLRAGDLADRVRGCSGSRSAGSSSN